MIMNTNIFFILCEGPHDVAFINKILKTEGYKSFENKKINELPFPINDLIVNEAKKSNVEDLNIQELRQSLLPTNSLQKDNKYVFLYILGGDSRKDRRKGLIQKLKSYIPEQGEITAGRINDDIILNVIYFFDADQIGIKKRLTAIEKEMKEVLISLPDNSLDQNGKCINCEGLTIGCFIFTGNNNDTGKLENILLPLMKVENEKIFEGAESFLNNFYDEERLYPMKIEIKEGGITETRSNKEGDKLKFDKEKSLIATVGQLQKSGMANTVCIGQTDYLTLMKIKADQKCQEIIEFINRI